MALWAMIPVASEDAYITFRYARNLAAGHGLVYNPGERVMGFTSPLWTLWLAAGYALTHRPEIWARLTALCGDVATLVLGAQMLRRHLHAHSAWCFAFFFAVWPYCAAVAVSGMETSATLALIFVAAVLAHRGAALSGPALAALGLMRPEGLAAAAVIALGARWRDRLVAAGLITLGLVSLTLYFGSPVPESVLAKSRLYGTPGPWVGRYWWEWLSPFVLGRLPSLLEPVHLFLMSVVFAPAVVLGAAALWSARRSALVLTVGACVTVWLGYALLGVAYFWWYLLIPLGGLALLASAGFPRLVRGRGVPVAAMLFVLGMWTIAPQLYVGRAQTEFRLFGQVANLLAGAVHPGDKVLLEPIGMVGYRAPVVIRDEVGLVSPEVARRRLRGAGWYADVARAEQPDWLVVRAAFLRGGDAFAGAGAPFRDQAERDSLFARYRDVAIVDSSSGDQALVVLKRQP